MAYYDSMMMGGRVPINQDYPVFFLGFEASLFKLKHYGWEVRVEFTEYRQEHRLMIRNGSLDLMGVSDYVDMREMMRGYGRRDYLPPFTIREVSPRMYEMRVQASDMMGDHSTWINPGDPMMVSMSEHNLFEEGLFTPAEKEIYVPESAADALDRILEMQAPAKRERAKQAVREGAKVEEKGRIILFG